MKKYKCKKCGYIYDPYKGDEDANISPPFPFENLPIRWKCPICGAEKVLFIPSNY